MAMCLTVTYTPYPTSSKEKTGNLIMFAQFEEGNLLTETRNDTESGDESDSKSIMMSEQDMENLDSNEKFDDNFISMEMLKDICDGSQTHSTVNKKEASDEIRDRIKRKELQWKGALKAACNMGKGLHTVFSTLVNDIFAGIGNFGRIWFRSFPFHTRT